MNIRLYIQIKYAILSLQWRSILVGSTGFGEGPKNPLKGTSVKPLVSASYAQSGVDAGGRRYACGFRAVFNGIKIQTLLLWRPDIVQERTPHVVSDFCTIPDMNLHCGATRLYAVNAVCSVACLAWTGRERGAKRPSPWPWRQDDISLKVCLQKRIRAVEDRCGKHLGCLKTSRYGIAVRTKWQSGNGSGNVPACASKGNRLSGDGRLRMGKTNPT